MNKLFDSKGAFLRSAFLFILFGISAAGYSATTYYVATNGLDSNPGTFNFPWLTIQKANLVMLAGDTTIVRSGNYDERITTVRSGTATNRITFKAEGEVKMRGFAVNHSYITIDGFTLTRHYSPNRQNGYIEVFGDHFRILNNTFTEGVALTRDDFVFLSDISNTNYGISTATGGLIAAGFEPGQIIRAYGTARYSNMINNGVTMTVTDVTDNFLTLITNPPINFLSKPAGRAYVVASINYGLVVNSGASFGIVRSNRFDNLDYDCGYLGGEYNLYEFNTFERCGGWDAFHFMGMTNVFRRNFVNNSPSPLKMYSNLSPDAFETFSPARTTNILFEENFVSDFSGVLGIINDGQGTNMSQVTFLRNVFDRTGWFTAKVKNTTFINNTFYRMAQGPTDSYEDQPHPLQFYPNSPLFNMGLVTIQNNIFVGCGSQLNNTQLNGWYEISGTIPFTNRVIGYNFVAGVAPVFESKIGFNEGIPALNGGDPGFVNIDDPLGPDGLPFTADDGLRLRPDSKLVGSGDGGIDIGAYINPPLLVSSPVEGIFSISWPAAASDLSLQAADAISGPWVNVNAPVTITNSRAIVDIATSEAAAFYRLAK